MRILLFVTQAFGALGGIAEFNRSLIEALAASESCSELVVFPFHGKDPAPHAHPKLRYHPRAGLGKLHYFMMSFAAIGRATNFDLIICGHLHLLPVAYLFHLRSGAPLLLLIHGIEAWQPSKHALTNSLSRKVSALAAVSEYSLKRFSGWSDDGSSRKPSFLLPNCINLRKFSPGPKPEALLKRYSLGGKKVLLTVARLEAEERYKGLDEVLAVLPSLRREIPALHYLVVGDGSDRKRLEAEVARLGLKECVTFTGQIDEIEKRDHYLLADAFVMPSRGEGFGIVFLEALACGIPVVGSKADASREVLRDGKVGEVVDPGDPRDVEEGIKRALQRERGVAPDILRTYTVEEFSKRAIEICREVARKPAC